MPVNLKRAYEKPSRSDGTRVLVDRLWPRGLKKEAAALDAWLKDVAPSNELRRWFHARPALWPAFRKKYLRRTRSPGRPRGRSRNSTNSPAASRQLTLVFSARNQEHNNAVILKQLLEGMRKPPSTSGPKGAAATSARAARAQRRR